MASLSDTITRRATIEVWVGGKLDDGEYRTFEVEASISIGKVLQWQGEQACRNKSGVAKDGYVTVKRLRQVSKPRS